MNLKELIDKIEPINTTRYSAQFLAGIIFKNKMLEVELRNPNDILRNSRLLNSNDILHIEYQNEKFLKLEIQNNDK